MANIIEFPTHKVKRLALIDSAPQEVPVIDAVNELTCELLSEVTPIYVQNGWSLGELDSVVADFQSLMIANAPSRIMRAELNEIKQRLRPIWKDLMLSIRGPKDF